MRARRHIIMQAAVAGTALACLLAAPAPASAGGIDATKECVEDAYLGWNPGSTRSTFALIEALKLCNSSLMAHFMDTRARDEWQRCVMYGLSRSVPPLGWEPALYGLVSCSQTWLGFHPELPPPPAKR